MFSLFSRFHTTFLVLFSPPPPPSPPPSFGRRLLACFRYPFFVLSYCIPDTQSFVDHARSTNVTVSSGSFIRRRQNKQPVLRPPPTSPHTFTSSRLLYYHNQLRHRARYPAQYQHLLDILVARFEELILSASDLQDSSCYSSANFDISIHHRD